MTTALLIGSMFGALVGLIHAVAVFSKQVSRARARRETYSSFVYAKSAYFAIWTFCLWILFGSYVLYLWILAAVLYTGQHTWLYIKSVSNR